MPVEIRKGTTADIEDFIRFLAEIRQSMVYQEWFYLDPPELVRKMMAEGVLELWVAMDGDRMVAVYDILHPGLREYNYGYDLDYSEQQLLRVVNLDNAAVHPDYRGQGLQGKMMKIAEEYLQGKGETDLLCTIHPDNRFSLNNALKQGYEIVKTQSKYGSVRHFLRKKIF